MEDLSKIGTRSSQDAMRIGDEVAVRVGEGPWMEQGPWFRGVYRGSGRRHNGWDCLLFDVGSPELRKTPLYLAEVRLIRAASAVHVAPSFKAAPVEDLSTMGTPTTWDAVGVGDEVAVKVASAPWEHGKVTATSPGCWIFTDHEGREWPMCSADPVRLLSRALTADECARLDAVNALPIATGGDLTGLAEGVTRAVERAAAVTAAVGAGSAAVLPVESTQGTPIEGLATVGEVAALHAYVAAREERHTLAMAIRSFCGITEDEPDGDLPARLLQTAAVMRSWVAEAREQTAAARADCTTLAGQLAEADGEIKSLTYRMDEIEALVEAAAVLGREPVYPISKATRVALLRSVRA